MSRHATTALLSAYLDEELEAEEVERMQIHLEECEPCRQNLVGLRAVVGALHSLERQAPSPVLGQTVVRRAQAFGQPRAWVQRLETRLQKLRLDTSPFVTFALVLALAVILLVFAQSLQRSTESTRLIVLPSVHKTVVDGRVFERTGGAWIVQGLKREGARVIASDSSEGRDLRSRMTGLDDLLADLPVVFELESGEKIELRQIEVQFP